MRRLLRVAVFAALGSFVWTSSVWAQSSRGTTSSSASRSLTSSGTRSTGSSSSSRFGTPASSQSSQVSAVENSLDSRINQMMPADENLRSARGADDFVGADRGDVRNLTGFEDPSQTQRSSSRTTSNSRLSGRQSSANRSNRQRSLSSLSNRQRRSGTAASEVQPVLRLGFDYATATSPALGADLAAKLYRRSQALSGAKVELNGGVVTLTGTAGSEHARALAEQLVALEPGVRRVENRLTVASPAPSTTGSAAGGPVQP